MAYGYSQDSDEAIELSLDKIVSSVNVADRLSKEERADIARKVYDEFLADKQSRQEWDERQQKAFKLALQVMETKSFPWPGASNVKFPLVTIAALQYHARAYPALIEPPHVVKCRVIGPDPDGQKQERAKRVSSHMSWQVLEQDECWEEETDRALIAQPIVGCAFKKTYYDPFREHNVSEFVPAQDIYVSYYTKSLETSPRVTQLMRMSRNDLWEREKSGLFLETTDVNVGSVNTDPLTEARNEAQGVRPYVGDADTPFEVIEQHRYLDLDGDGYAEPYIVWVRCDTMELLRIKARFFESNIRRDSKNGVKCIEPEHFFTKIPFIPSPDGGFYDLGFGSLLGPLNESVSTLINQLIDSGTVSNTSGGFLARGMKIKGGEMAFKPFEWKRVDSTGDDLRKAVFPLPVRDPSSVLFQLLGMLVDFGQRVGAATDTMSGVSPGQNTPAETSRNTLEQGMKVFGAIYKRTYRAFKSEFQKLYRLNQLYLGDSADYEEAVSGSMITQQDYDNDPTVVRPSADPAYASDSMRMGRLEAVRQAAMTAPGLYNMYEVNKMYLMELKVPNIELILPDPKGPNALPPPPPDTRVQVENMKMQAKQITMQGEMQMLAMKLQAEAVMQQAKVFEMQAKAASLLTQAKNAKTTQEIAMLNAQIGLAKAHHDSLVTTVSTLTNLYGVDLDNKREMAKLEVERGNERSDGASQYESRTAPPNME